MTEKKLTQKQRQKLRGIFRREAYRLGYITGEEMQHQPRGVRELYALARKIPMYETPTGYMPTQAELDEMNGLRNV